MRIAFSTFGCKINQFETDELRQSAQTGGHTVVPFDDAADVYVINTCSVTGKTDYQCRQAIRAAVHRGKGAQVIVTGCYASTRPEDIRKITGVGQVVGNDGKRQLKEYFAGQGAPQKDVGPPARTRAFLKIQDGCNSYCSYCIIPFARGASRSAEQENILARFDELVAAGTPEIVLTGIHVGKYGADLGPGRSLSGLVRELLQRRGNARIRLSSIEPNEITNELIGLLGQGLCRHLHIPLQSGSDRILGSMNRTYTSRSYRELLDALAAAVPGIAIGCDVIVGYPGEGDREFQETLQLVRDSPVTHLHVFAYSRRPGTVAAGLSGQCRDEEKKERSAVMRQLGEEKNLAFRRSFLGQSLEIVLERQDERNSLHFNGISDNYIRVSATGGTGSMRGTIRRVRISSISEAKTLGEIETY